MSLSSPAHSPKLHPTQAEAARSGLQKIFWGTLLCVLDFWLSYSVNGSGFRIDVLNDVAGILLILWGLGQLAPLWDEPSYRNGLSACKVLAIIALIQAALDHIIVRWPPPLSVASSALGLLSLLAVLFFCQAMRTFCWLGQLLDSEQSWRLSTKLFLILNFLPAAILQAASVVLYWMGRSQTVRLSSPAMAPAMSLAIPLLIAAIVPLIHILLSISRTRRDLLDDAALPRSL